MKLKKLPISISHPELLEEWDYQNNLLLTPNEITSGSDKKVWWVCLKNELHRWEASISHRVSGRGCPFCSGKKVNSSNSLQTTNPKLIEEWDFNQNLDIAPTHISAGSSKKVWWICRKDQTHKWQSSIANRVKGRGCPFCSGRNVSNLNSLEMAYPEIAKEWHPIKNGNVTPNEISKGIVKKFWWRCPNNFNHDYEASPNNRTKGKGCPYCSGKKINSTNSLLIIRPNIAKEWHPTKNQSLSPYDVTTGSNKVVWWKCDKGEDHEWQASIAMRTRLNQPSSCPICSNHKTVKSNSLAIINPDLAKEWNLKRNGKITPYDFTKGSLKSVWWKCDKGEDHEWQAPIRDRNLGNGCPVCSGIKVTSSNNLGTGYPKIAKEWHPIKNGSLTPSQIYKSSSKKVWWKCNKGPDHEWNTSVYHRTRNESGCPFCTLTPQSRQELCITFELKSIFSDIDPKGFKTRINGKIWSIDIFIPELNLGIEFDGSYWHKDKADLDKLKTKQLKEDGFQIIRVREEPLQKLSDWDIISSKKFDGKKISNKLFEMILAKIQISNNYNKKIQSYLLQNDLQNQNELDIYIEKILLEKSIPKN